MSKAIARYTLLWLAIWSALLLSPFLIIRGIIKWGSVFAGRVAKDIDRTGETLIWNTGETHTISAMVYIKNKKYWVKFINWIFQDDNHCKKAYKKEFNQDSNI